MRLVIQVVSRADVKIDGRTAGEIGPGMMVLLGVNGTDTEAVADKMVKKVLALRIFPDENGKTNRSLADIGGRAETAPASSRQARRRWQTISMSTC